MAHQHPHHAVNDNADLIDHVETYRGFVALFTGGSILCGYLVVALLSFWFAKTAPFLLGFSGLILGMILVTIDFRMKANWILSSVGVVVYALIVAVSIAG